MKKLIFLGILIAMTSCSQDQPTVKAAVQDSDLDSLLEIYPDSIPFLLRRGTIRVESGLFSDALADAARAFRLDTTNLDARRLYATALTNKADRTVADINDAQRHFHAIIKKRPKDLKALVGLASTYRLQENYETTFKYVNEALRVDPKYRDAYVLKGSTYLIMGNTRLAKSSYETAVQQDPEFFEAYIMLGSLYQAENDPICIQYYTTAKQLRPNDMDAIYALAYAKQLFGKIEEAKELYRAMAGDTTDYFIQRGLFHQGYIHQFGEKNLDSAIYFYNSALLTNPMYVESWYNLGLCYADQKDKTRALQSFGKALKYGRQQEYEQEFLDEIEKEAAKNK
ncbi:MAG: tetratricopeptide repeat protein [Bacteroidetes bacterium]|nr:MAG: tetratricopeptide repeat protein [Bacteroidota bacterium]TNE97507.1 MAG: tetratricopeptide repeat protein [Bacteroidota bacterium]